MPFVIHKVARVAVSIRQGLNTLPVVLIIPPSTFEENARPRTALDPLPAALVILPLAGISLLVGPGKFSFPFFFAINPLAIVPHISIHTNEGAVAMLVVVLPLSYVLCSVALVPVAFAVLISIHPLSIVLNDKLLLSIAPNGSKSLAMLQTVLPFSSILRPITVGQCANPLMLIECPLTIVNLA